jgi:hypothetical protein
MLILTPTGATTRRPMPASDHDLLAALQAALGASMVETITLSRQLIMWADEEALLEHAPMLNQPAARVAAAHRRGVPVCGTVAFTGGPGPREATLALTDEQANTITALATAARAPAGTDPQPAPEGTVR